MGNRIKVLLEKAVEGDGLSAREAASLYKEASLTSLMAAAYDLRLRLHPDNKVTWIIDRNVNISNVCHAGCIFCNFSCSQNSGRAYVTTIDEYRQKIDELIAIGGRQLLLQGGLHPALGLEFYKNLFMRLKQEYPALRLHALGPPEIVHLSKHEGISAGQVLDELTASGLDSLPGAGAEILTDRIRKKLSPGKCSTGEWLMVMAEAHKRGLVTSATMMFGHIETIEERIEHLLLLRDLQNRKPDGATGFISFIPWPFQDQNTVLARKHQVYNTVGAVEYIRMIALSRLVLNNIPNIQPSWLTVGIETAQICLHGGGNDFGSVMMEENVVSSAGANYRMDPAGMKKAIAESGFRPVQRDQEFNPV